MLTPLIKDNLDAIIAHINDEHSYDLLTLAMYGCQYQEKPTPHSATLSQIYLEGLLLLSQSQTGTDEIFLFFDTPISDPSHLQKHYIELLSKAGKATSRRVLELVEESLIVINTQSIGNFVRILVKLPNNTPTDKAGLAYLFKVGQNEERYYTLRKAWHEEGQCLGYIDVFTHGDTLGSVWAKNLKASDVLMSTRRYPEKTEHLSGHVLLIGDETSLPTVLRVLELQTFSNPLVIACLKDNKDLRYLEDCQAPIVHLNYDAPYELLPKILASCQERIQTIGAIDSVWAALEVDLIKALRPALKEILKLDKSTMVVKVYWRQTH